MISLFYLLILFSSTLQEENQIKPNFVQPAIPKNAYIALYFNSSSDLNSRLIISKARKEGVEEAISKYEGVWSVEVPRTSAIENDYALVLKSKAMHHAISVEMDRPIDFKTNEVVIQYEVKFQEPVNCAGAYIKLLSTQPMPNLKEFNDKTPYTIMFGPDKCGLDHKLHFIFRHKNPISGKFEEKHAKKVNSDLEQYFSDAKSHLYTLVLRSDNTFERYIDLTKVQSGSMLEDFEPPVNPPLEIDDPNDKKPSDWDDRPQIVDETAVKPSEWDENAPEFIMDVNAVKPAGWLDNEEAMIPDPSAQPPADWDSEMDGVWEAPQVANPKCANAPGCGVWQTPMIQNPDYKGKWTPPLISNPAYKGVWKPKIIPNPNYFEDKNPFRSLTSVGALGLELWSMDQDIAFDNFIVTDSKQAADEFASQTWVVKNRAEKLADPKSQSVVDAARELFSEKPWLVAVIGLVCTLPIILCFVYFRRSTPAVHVHKKTDQYTPKNKTPTPRGTDVETESGEEDIVEVSKGSGDESHGRTNTGSESNGEGSTAHNEESSNSKQTLRKRRSRKE